MVWESSDEEFGPCGVFLAGQRAQRQESLGLGACHQHALHSLRRGGLCCTLGSLSLPRLRALGCSRLHESSSLVCGMVADATGRNGG